MTAPSRVTTRVIIKGRVQGVWFRGWTCDEAQLRGLSGWVRNRRDGDVEALFSGSADKVSDMLQACRNGPPAANVLAIETEAAVPPPDGAFRQLPSV